ncbi:uncharacterized protein LOC119588946 [Penaeus monodon]|uniref:uncharacterized protein LOC119588946 n=1 Tax=Penaeus monodon TaxID=6687 RepID=UPI0018A7AD6A|nr:uncharacterized protein LOC119588946 [Penaeus monodon]
MTKEFPAAQEKLISRVRIFSPKMYIRLPADRSKTFYEKLPKISARFKNIFKEIALDFLKGPSAGVEETLDASLRSCSIIDNYYVDEPVWMVDLGKRKPIRGLVILTWQGRGQDQQTLYRDYVFGLDRLTVYVENQARIDSPNSQDHKKCASVTRLNNALFRERVHMECPQPMKGPLHLHQGRGRR